MKQYVIHQTANVAVITSTFQLVLPVIFIKFVLLCAAAK